MAKYSPSVVSRATTVEDLSTPFLSSGHNRDWFGEEILEVEGEIFREEREEKKSINADCKRNKI